VQKRNPTDTTLYFWDGDALLAEVERPNRDIAELSNLASKAAADGVIDLRTARDRLERVRAVGAEAREYVYRPHTFEPLLLLDRVSEAQCHARGDANELESPAPVGDDPLAAPPTPAPASAAPARPVTADRAPTTGGLGSGMRLGAAAQGRASDGQAPVLSAEPGPIGRLGAVRLPGRPAEAMGGAEPAGSVCAPRPTSATPPAAALVPHVFATQRVTLVYQNDPNGCPTRLLDRDTGQVVWAAGLHPGGRVVPIPGAQRTQRLRLQGQQHDEETGLCYNRHRYFEPRIGAFVSKDPIGPVNGESFFAYAPNVLRWIDPVGLTCQRLSGNATVDRVAREIDAAALHASRMLDRGLTGNTPWGSFYQRLARHNPGHWMLPMARGNAVQQIADASLQNNRLLREAGVVFNQGHLQGMRNAAGNLVRPDYQIPMSGGRLGIIDITTPGQAGKISKYLGNGTSSYPWTNVHY
jgi:RHS repeat-associated protein